MPRITELLWDDWNEAHIAEHGVLPNDVEDAALSPSSLLVRIQRSRYRLLGQTESGRYLMVILDHTGAGRFYPVTARDTTDNERRRLQHWRGS
jgi:uncharacterized DUF497 family protein